MDQTSFIKRGLHDPRLAVHATGGAPVWLWSLDGGHVLWANPAACAAFGVETPSALASRTFEPAAPVRLQIARLAATLPQNGAARLERLRGFADHGPHPLRRPLVCSCALFRLDQLAGVLVVAAEAAGPVLSLGERVRRLGLDDETLAAFTPDGAFLFATPPARQRLGDATTTRAIGAEALAATAMAVGMAAGDASIGPLTLRRIGSGADTVLLGSFEPARAASEAPTPTSLGDTGTTGEPAPLPPPASAPPEPEKRRHPLRFVWQMDPGGRFTLGSDEFTEIIGTRNAIALGRPWQEINSELGLDPAGRFAAASATRETWSSITVSWPVDHSDERLDVELAGLPAFDRNRTFLGYRGFGVCRDIERIERLRAMRRLALFAPMPPAVEPSDPKPHSPDSAGHPEEGKSARATARNVVPFPSPAGFGDAKPGGESKSPALSPGEHVAFRELARQLAARLQDGAAPDEHLRDLANVPPVPATGQAVAAEASEHPAAWMFEATEPSIDDHALLNRLPVGILIYRLDELLFANRAFLTMTGYPDITALAGAGGLDALFVEAGIGALADPGEGGRQLAIATRSGSHLPVEGRLFATNWNREPAFAVLLAKAEANERIRLAETALRQAETQVRELRTMLEGATDATLVIEDSGRVLSGNRGSEIMFGRALSKLEGTEFASLFAARSRDAAAAALAQAARSSGGACARLEVEARDGSFASTSVTINPLGEGTNRLGVAIRDIAALGVAAPLPSAQETAKQEPAGTEPAKPAASDKSEVLAKLCHDARTQLNAILGFCDIMTEERYGPIGNARYRDYVSDIRQAGTYLMALLVDAVDLASIEAGTFSLTPGPISLNDVLNEGVARMQPQANEGHVIVRTSLSPSAQNITADAGAVRQIVANLLGYVIKGSRPGGQVIVSTGTMPDGAVVLRLRDNGPGLSEKAIEAALQPAGPTAGPFAITPPFSLAGATLPLTKALAEACGGRFKITSRPQEGSLFELTFPGKSNVAG